MRFTPAFFLLLIPCTVHTQTPAAPAPQTLTGCVARLAHTSDKYVMAAGGRCLLLAGSYQPAQVADHEITAKGLVLEPVGMAPLTLNIQSVVSTGAACTRTCVLAPPGTRGIHGKERPGKEGGTPGVTSPNTPN